MQILKQKILFHGENSPICSATFPWVTQMPSGRILVMFRGGPLKGPTNAGEDGWYCWSDDGGDTFTAPSAPLEAPLLDGAFPSTVRGFQLLPLGGERLFCVATVVRRTADDVPYFNEATEGLKDTRLFTCFSEDGGRSFTPLRELRMEGQFAGLCHVLTGPPLLLSDGRVMVNFEVYKQYDDPRPIDHKAGCIFSEDGGRTWGREVTICDSPDVYAWDHRACEAAPGLLLDHVWTFDRHTNNYRTIGCIRSEDGGRTWGALRETGLNGQAGNAVRLPDGRISLIYIDRTGTPTVKLAFSRDLGETWLPSYPIYVHEAPRAEHKKSAYGEAWTEMGKFTAGHPFQTVLRSGRLLCVHYAGASKDQTNLMLTWAEP